MNIRLWDDPWLSFETQCLPIGPATVTNKTMKWTQHVWNVKTSPKIKDFLWRVVKKAILVSSNLERRGFQSFNCKRCGGVEDDLHALLTCPLEERVWI